MLRNWALALRPSLSLDFLAGLNDSRITYSGGANGTRVNSAGVIVAAATPRFDYDPVTLAAKGLLVEEARTNLCLRSEDFTNASWQTVGTATVTANTTVSPDGTQNADTVTANAADSIIYQQIAVSASTTYTGSFYMKAATNTTVTIYILTAGFAALGSQVCNVTTQWQRFSVTAATGVNTSILLSIGGGATFSTPEAVIPWGAQLEAGSFPTSYIPTTSASVTRTADSAVMTGTNFSSWYNQSEGTFVFAGSRLTAGGTVGVAFGAARTGDFNNSIYAANATASQMATSVLSGGVAQAATVGSPASVLVPFRFATAYALNDFASCANGGAVGVDVAGTPPTLLDIFAIGSSPWAPPANSWNGHIRSIVFYPSARPGSLQALSS